ncbi:hypothetical protein KCV04_g1, partial [Aureobasidium melanogenum]
MLSSSLLSDCADTGFAAAFAVLSSSSRRRMVDPRIRFLPISYGAGKIIVWLWLTQRFKVACSLEIIKCCNRV